MRILVISDTHGRRSEMEQLLSMPVARTADWLVHCGDIGQDEMWLRRAFSGAVSIVAGNNDFFTDLPKQIVVERDGHRFLVLHGHRQVYGGLGRFLYMAQENDCDVVMFGHTHAPLVESEAGVTFVNPGSLSMPRQSDRRKTYAVVDVNGAEVSVTVHGLP